MVRVRVYRTMRVAKAKYLEYCEHNIGNIKMKRFNGRGKGVPVVLLKNNDFVLFMSFQVYVVWCKGRTYYDDIDKCYKHSGYKVSNEIAEQYEYEELKRNLQEPVDIYENLCYYNIRKKQENKQ